MSDSLLNGPRDAAVGTCPAGYLWYSCANNNFEGCCSQDPCSLKTACPVDSRPMNATSSLPEITPTTAHTSSTFSSAETTSATSPLAGSTNTEATSHVSSAPIVSIPTTTATVITASALSSSPTFPWSTTTTLITIPPSSVTVVVVPPSSSGNVTIATLTVPPGIPSSSTTQFSAAATASAATHHSANQVPASVVIGLSAGIVVLIVTMGVIICVLWRNRKIKVVGEGEAIEMRRGRFAHMRPYYLAQPGPTPQPRPQVQKPAEPASSVTTPVRARIPGSSFPDVMTPFRDRYPSANSMRRAQETSADQPCVAESSPVSQHSSREPFASRGGRIDHHASNASIPWTLSSSSRAQSIRSVLYSHTRPTSTPGRPRPFSSASSGALATGFNTSQRWSSESGTCGGAATLRYSANSHNVSPMSSRDIHDCNRTISPLSIRVEQRDSEVESLASPRPESADFEEDPQRTHYHDLTPPPRRFPRFESSEAQRAVGDQPTVPSSVRPTLLAQGVAEEIGEGEEVAAGEITNTEEMSSTGETNTTDDINTPKDEKSTTTTTKVC